MYNASKTKVKISNKMQKINQKSKFVYIFVYKSVKWLRRRKNRLRSVYLLEQEEKSE